ncbi:MAG TPA: hypothetical protein VHE33_17130 [Acidobacteriaceae bacterium]|nr:hypothetical protein [Acidobacteriaceae bacterium]
MIANCDRHRALLRRVVTTAFAVAVGVSLNASAQTSLPADHAANGQSYSSSNNYQAYLSTDSLLGGSSYAEPSGGASASPQYGGNRRSSNYPSYESRWSHFAFNAGAGFTIPIGNTTSFNRAEAEDPNGPLSPSQGLGYNVDLGAGWNFSKRFGVLLDYEFLRDSIPNDYTDILAGGSGTGLGGNINTWSLALDPIIYLPMSRKSGAYVTGGGGFYRKVTNFTEPVEECDYYYGCYGVPVTVEHFSSNQGGANFGIGFYHKLFGEDSNGKFYAQVKYVFVNSPRPSTSNFGQGSGTEELLPVTFGVRF